MNLIINIQLYIVISHFLLIEFNEGTSNPYQIFSFGEEQLFYRLFLVASFCVNEMSLKGGT